MASVTSSGSDQANKTAFAIIVAVSFCHLLNDIMQSLLTAIYPVIKDNYQLDYTQIGILTFTFQVTASLLQPLIGIITDRWPMPYSLPVGMLSTCTGLITLAFAHDFSMLLIGASLIGLGSAIFHPESSRVARLASGGRHGLAQSLFQVGGNAGSAMGPLLAAFIVLPYGQGSVAWFSLAALIGFFVLIRVGKWYSESYRSAMHRTAPSRALPLPRRQVIWALLVLVLLTTTKNVYMASFSSYFTFYTIERFGVSVQNSQLLLFLFLGASAAGVFLGGPIGDRFGTRFVIWFSILGVIPFALLLPYASLFWTAVLTVIIGLIFSSAFSNIVVFAQELVPGRVGMIAGVFFGFAFGAGGVGAALLGGYVDLYGIEFVYKLCSYFPLLGVLTIFLPRLSESRGAKKAA
ncbi:MFS transporter [Rhizobium sp. CFBP 8762]|uniref:MFS transporter n=1 Tax=Rhizobium sp. CFBP 8762 TaxID=2775279 RepID=UPI00178196EF|nr:MFS transporter [Rhizobium sp. CFBP 8762]MBD8556621.1 MFS transporter [Rhizobium sp. CFBP 8762]